MNKTDYPAITNICDGPFAATNYSPGTVASAVCPPIWANERTWVYWGEVYIEKDKTCFAAKIDDWTYLEIDGKVYMDENIWNTVERSGPLPLETGWHAFEVRFGNGSGGAGPAAGIPVGFGINHTGEDSAKMDDYEYPFDPMGSAPVVFRYDDGLGFDDALAISGEPAQYGKPTPDYGTLSGLLPGAEIACSVPAVVEVGPGEKAFSTGWTLYEADVDTCEETPVGSGTDRELRYIHGEKARHLVWNWAVSNYVAVVASEGGSVEPKSQWIADGEEIVLTAVAGEGHAFFKWSGDVPFEQLGSATITLRVDKPISVIAQFVSSAPPGDKQWSGAGDGFRWEDGANWEPAGVPTLGDNVRIPTGKVLAETTVLAHGLEIGEAAELWLGASNKVEQALSLFPGVEKNYEMSIIGDLSCAGTLVLGGAGEAGSSRISIGGDFTLSPKAKASVIAASVSSVEEPVLRSQPTSFHVGGTFTVGAGAILHVDADRLTGAHVYFQATDIVIDGTLDAVKRGWDYFTAKPALPGFIFHDTDGPGYYTYAFGPGRSFGCGGGHGGPGGGSNGAFGLAYGNEYAPCLPGSPNGCYNKPARGGGVLRLHADKSFTLNGTVDASGGNMWIYGASSGGSVWIETERFEMDDEAILRARGGSNDAYTSSGAGGRICVMVGLQPSEIASISTTGELPAGIIADDFTFLGDVRGGRASYDSNAGIWFFASAGTSRYLQRSDSNVNVHISTEPAGVSTLEPAPGWGFRSFPSGIEMVLTAPAAGTDPAVDNAERYRCTGYVVSNATGVIDEGVSNRIAIPGSEKGPLWVTWLYGQKEARSTVYGITNGVVRIDGATFTGSVPLWKPMGAELPAIEAVADEGYEFLFWTGGVPYGKAKENPLHLTMDVVREVRPVFRKAEPPTTRTWIVKRTKGEWLEPKNREPAGIPGFEDDIVIPDGACNVSNYLECASLTLSGKAVLRLATSPLYTNADHYWLYSCPLEENSNVFRAPEELGEVALVVHGDLVMTNTAKLRLGIDRQPSRGRVEIGGVLRMGEKTVAVFSAGPIDGEQVTHVTGSGLFNVGEMIDVGPQARLILISDQETGGSFAVRTKDLHVREGGSIDVSNRGYGYAKGSRESRGPGRGCDYTIGGGYGGLGVGHNKLYGHTYGQQYAPVEPGSPAGYYNQQTIASGLIRIHADKATIDGKLLATSVQQPYGGCSGGGIWLTARWIGFGDQAVLDASGADTGYSSKGGGGRIAIEKGLSPAAIDHLAATGELPRGMEKRVLDVLAFTNLYPKVTVDLTRGDHVSTPENDGTFVYLNAVPEGTMLMLR